MGRGPLRVYDHATVDRRPNIDNGIAYLLICFALLVVFMIWVYNTP